MEWNSLIEENTQDLRENDVQNAKKEAKNPKKKRSQSDKFGTNKYTQVLTKRALVEAG